MFCPRARKQSILKSPLHSGLDFPLRPVMTPPDLFDGIVYYVDKTLPAEWKADADRELLNNGALKAEHISSATHIITSSLDIEDASKASPDAYYVTVSLTFERWNVACLLTGRYSSRFGSAGRSTMANSWSAYAVWPNEHYNTDLLLLVPSITRQAPASSCPESWPPALASVASVLTRLTSF